MALAFPMMMITVGNALGPIATGFLQKVPRDLALYFLLVSFPALFLTMAGVTLLPVVREVVGETLPTSPGV